MDFFSDIDPEKVPGLRRSDIYTPLDPLGDYNDVNAEENLDEDPDLDEPEVGQAIERPEQPALDGDIAEQTPGHHEADRNFQYDEEDVDNVAR